MYSIEYFQCIHRRNTKKRLKTTNKQANKTKQNKKQKNKQKTPQQIKSKQNKAKQQKKRKQKKKYFLYFFIALDKILGDCN